MKRELKLCVLVNMLAVLSAFVLLCIWNTDSVCADELDTQIQKVVVSARNQAILTVKRIKGADGYEIYRSGKKNGGYKKAAHIGSSQYTDKKRKRKAMYYYKVRAYSHVDGKLQAGKFSRAVRAGDVRSVKLGMVKSVATKAGNNQVNVKWKKVSGKVKYQVYRAVNKGKYQKIAVARKNAAADRINRTATYGYKVRAYKQSGKVIYYGAFSKIKKRKMTYKVKLSKVTGVKVSQVSEGIRISWKRVKGADGYRVYQYNIYMKGYTFVKTVKGVSYVHMTFPTEFTKKKFCFKVRAYRGKSKGAYSGVKSITMADKALYYKGIVKQANEYRAKLGLKPYIWSDKLAQETLVRAKEVSVKASHTRLDGTHCNTAYTDYTQENIAFTMYPKQAFENWLESPGHKELFDKIGYPTYIGCSYYNGYMVATAGSTGYSK